MMIAGLYQFCQEIIAGNVHLPLNPVESDNISDKVQEYAMEEMSLGIFYLNYKDTIKHGDGGRVLGSIFCQFSKQVTGETTQLKCYLHYI